MVKINIKGNQQLCIAIALLIVSVVAVITYDSSKYHGPSINIDKTSADTHSSNNEPTSSPLIGQPGTSVMVPSTALVSSDSTVRPHSTATIDNGSGSTGADPTTLPIIKASPSTAVLPFIISKTSTVMANGSSDYFTAQLNPRGNPDGTVSNSQILCNATGSSANGLIYAVSSATSPCSNINSFSIYVKPETPAGRYQLRVIVNSLTNVNYYGDITVTVYTVTPAPTPGS